jgi:ATP-binding cassette, subfamily B, bacterial MsbA
MNNRRSDTLKRLGSVLWPYRGVMLISILAMVLTAALEPVLPALLKPLVDSSLIAKDPKAQWLIPLALMVAFTLKGITDYISQVAGQWVAQKAIHDLRCQVFAHQLHLPLTEHQTQTSGTMLSRLLYDIPQLGAALATAWLVLLRDTLIILGLLGYLFWLAWELTLMILLMAPLVALIIQVASRKLRGGNQVIQQTTASLTGNIEESLLGVREIKVYGTHDFEGQRFAQLSNMLRQQTMSTFKIGALNVPLVQVMAAACVAMVIWMATMLSTQDKLSPGAFVSFVAAMSMLFEPIRRLTNINAVVQRGLAGADSLFKLLDTPPEVDLGLTAPTPKTTNHAARGHLQFEHVRFRYEGQDEWALNDVSLNIEPGKTLALVGASGSGKTSLIHLIPRFFDPQEGRILFDGQALANMPLKTVRSQVSWVGQHVVLFDDTLAANIAYGSPHASLADIERAARIANAWEFIERLPMGLETRIGPNGGQLSGGQRQRVAIARALLKQSPILLLDEATSALDTLSEKLVKTALEALKGQRTLIVVAHRMSTVREADEIIVLDQGRIVQRGTHAALSAQSGVYQRLLQSQLS